MRNILKTNPVVALMVLLLLAVTFAVIAGNTPKDITRDIERARFTIIKPIVMPNVWPVYLAAYNTCDPSNSNEEQCTIECGFGDLDPCYFFAYEPWSQKPRVIAKYHSRDDALYQTLMGFKDHNTLQFKTMKI